MRDFLKDVVLPFILTIILIMTYAFTAAGIVLGISGTIQFTSGMDGSDLIIAINNDPHAQIFDCAHYGIVGDVYKIVPELIKLIKEERGE